VVRALAPAIDGPEFETACAWDISKTLSVYPAETGYPGLFRGGEGESGEEEEWGTPPQLHQYTGSLHGQWA